MIMKRNAKDWGAMTHCSACSHDGSFVVRIASGNALWLRVCVCISGRHFECTNARGYWNCVAAGEVVRKTGTPWGQRARTGNPEAMGDGVCFLPLLPC